MRLAGSDCPRIVDAPSRDPYEGFISQKECDRMMNASEFQLICLRDERLAAHALGPNPVWLWSASTPVTCT